jgi:phage protein U
MKRMLFLLVITVFIISLFADGTNTSIGAPLVLTLPFSDTGDLIDNTNDNGDRYRDEWWEITPTINLTNLDIHPLYNGWDGYLFVYDANLNQIAFDDDGPGGTADSQIIMDVAAGETIFVVIDEYSASTAARTFTLNISADQTGPIVDPDAPGPISNVIPANGAIDVPLMPTLSWDFGSDTETYDLYFDTVNPPVTQIVSGAVAGATGSYTPPADLTDATVYYWKVVSHNTQTTTAVISNMSFRTIILPISVFPSTEDFEDAGVIPFGWEQGTEDDQNWSFGTSTSSTNTGPQAGDHTTGTGYFAYTEASGFLNMRFDLISRAVDVSTLTNPFCSFWYNMYGQTMGTLHVDVWDGTQWNEDVTPAISGDQGQEWHNMDIPLAAFGDVVKVRFRGVTGSDYYSDISIDDVSFWDNGTVPGAATVASPLDGATGVGMTGSLNWNFVMGSAGYYLNFGTDNPPTNLENNTDLGNVLSYDYTGLTSNTVYYWQVIPYNAIGNAANCPVWSFTSFSDVPLAATLVAPTDGAIAVIETPTLQWANGGQFPDGYRLNMGTNNPPTDLYNNMDLGNVTSYAITTPLNFQTTYYWQIVPYNFVGDALNCPVWSFTTNSNLNYGGDGALYGGYYFANSTVSGNGLGYQPVFEWVDISATGQTPAYSNADDGFVTVDIGFNFNFFGNDYTQVSLGTNGSIMFTNPTGSTSSSMTIPSATTPNDCVAMMAMDLHTTNIPSLCYYGPDDMGNFVYTVMMWNDYTDTNEYMDIQVILYPTGRIKIQYDNYVNNNNDTGSASMLGDACIGIENADGTLGHQYRLDGVGGPINDQMALCYAMSPSDLSDAGTGLFLPGHVEFNTVNVDSSSDAYQVRMRNFTDGDVTVASAPVMSGDNVDQFIVTDNNTYPLVIPAEGEATLSIVFHPTSTGDKTAIMTIVDDGVEPTRITHDITMHGYGFHDFPLAATLVSPADGAQAVIETPTLQWAEGGQFPSGYKLNMGTDNPPTNLYDDEDLGNVTSYDITTPLGFQTTYYWQIVPYNFVGDAVNCPVWSFTTNSNQNYGGDGTIYGGYYFANSTVSGNGLGYQPVFEWVDISATGQAPAYSNADDGFVTVDIGFPFNFFGNDYTQVSLGTNGSIMFTNPTGSTSSSMSIPSTTTPNDCVAMMAMDLHTTNIPSACYYGADEMGNFVYTVMMWNDYTDTSEYMDIQVILYPTGRIKIQYDNYMNPNGDTGTSSMLGDACIGIENADGTLGHQYRNNGVGGPINNQMALCYAQSTSDLSDGGAGLYLPGNIEYGVVNVNNNSTSYQVRMRNFTDADVTVASAPVMSGDNVDQFIVTDNNTYPLVIASGGEANLNIVFHPTSMGHKTAMMTIVDDAVEPTRISHDITMHGYGHIPDTNNTSATATEFAIYDEDVVNYQAIIEPATDIDWYVFWQTGPAEITMHTEQMNGSSVDLAAFIYGPFDDIGANVDEFASIDFSDDDWSDGISPSMATDVTESGFYYLRIARADNSPVRARDSRRAGRDSGQNWGSKASQGEAEPTDQRIERWDTGDYALWIHTNNPTPPAGFFPPSGLDTQITYQGINLTWFEPVPPPADRTLNGYNVYRDDVIINPAPVTALFYLDPVEGLVENQQYEYKITALYSAPAGESPACDSVMVTYISVDPPVIAESFEDYSDFVTTFGDWVVVDGDGENTYGFNNGINFPGENDAMAFIVFNPASTTPPLQFATAYSGDKYAACFAADTGSNDDWLISPQIQLTDAEAYVQLMARSYTTQFGMERFEVAVSNGSSDPDDFTVITGDQPIEVPLAWTPFSYSLDDFATDIVRVAVHCVSNQTFFMMLDDLMIVNDGAEVGNDPQPIIPEVTALTGNYPNPFNPVTTISFDLKENAQVSIDIYNIKGQRVATVADGNFNAGRHSIIWKGTDLHGNSVSSGVYFYKMSSGTYTKTKKMILMK